MVDSSPSYAFADSDVRNVIAHWQIPGFPDPELTELADDMYLATFFNEDGTQYAQVDLVRDGDDWRPRAVVGCRLRMPGMSPDHGVTLTSLGSDCFGRLTLTVDGKDYIAPNDQSIPFAAVGVVERWEQPEFMSRPVDAMEFTDVFGSSVLLYSTDTISATCE